MICLFDSCNTNFIQFLVNTRWQLNPGESPGLAMSIIHGKYLWICEIAMFNYKKFACLPSAMPRGINNNITFHILLNIKSIKIFDSTENLSRCSITSIKQAYYADRDKIHNIWIFKCIVKNRTVNANYVNFYSSMHISLIYISYRIFVLSQQLFSMRWLALFHQLYCIASRPFG